MGWMASVSAEAWDELVEGYQDLGGEDADDRALAALVHRMIAEVEG